MDVLKLARFPVSLDGPKGSPFGTRCLRATALYRCLLADVRLEQRFDQVECALAVGTHLAAAQDEARREAQHVPAPGTDERVVEIVQVEDHRLGRVAAQRLADAERARPVRAEVLDVRVADEPPAAGRSIGQRRVPLSIS